MAKISEGRAEMAARELLAIRGWNVARPPRGNVLWKNEYREHPELEKALSKASKTGGGSGYPEFIVVDPSLRPLMVGETKAASKDIEKAAVEAKHYASAFAGVGIDVLAVGVAGSAEEDVEVRVHKRRNGTWKPIEYQHHPIQWLPTFEETERLLLNPSLFALDPEVPPPEILESTADEINRILREARIADARRPAVVAAFMLAMWKTKGRINPHSEYVLLEVNAACKKAFTDAGKYEIADTITVEVANDLLAAKAHRILKILRLLNIPALTSAHDYLGQLYEHFFRYVGANTIGQYFTPRHITKFMADLCDVRESDVIVDPTCGTGGFLIACLYRMIGNRHLDHKQVADLVRGHIYGFESEPTTAGLCVANMILRGDGTSGIIKGDCFTESRYPVGKATVSIGNPPFPHKADDAQPEKFVDRALESLRDRGELAMVLPASMLVKSGTKKDWRKSVLRKNTLLAVIKLPDELFQPYATTYTNVVLMRKGAAHKPTDQVFWARIENDGLKLKKNVRVDRPGEQLTETLDAYRKRREQAGWCAWKSIEEHDWSPGAYIDSAPAGEDEIREEVESIFRSNASLHARLAPQVASIYQKLDSGAMKSLPYAKMTKRKPFTVENEPDCLGNYFNIFYGQKELHSKESLESGDTMVVSSSGEYNGCYGFFDFDSRIKPPFATVPATGSIGISFVQHLPCGVTDDCLILLPKGSTKEEALYVGAAVVRLERWRFSYGRKITPARIAKFKINLSDGLLSWVKERSAETQRLNRKIVDSLGSQTVLADRFRLLVEEWEKNRPRGANLDDMVAHAAYQRIVSMGTAAIPFLLGELAQKPGHWFPALHTITGVNPVPIESEGKVKRMADAWIEWGRKEGYIA